MSCVIISLVVLTASLSLVEGASIPTVTVGGIPFGAAVTPDGKYLYVANFENVTVIDTATNKVAASIVTEKFPMGIAITPNGEYTYVTHSTSYPPVVSVISTATNTVVDTITLEHSANDGIAITSDGKYAYLTNMEGWVMVISTETNVVVANVFIEPHTPDYTDPTNGVTLPSFSYPVTVAISPDDAYAYVGTGNGDNRVVVIDVSTNKIINSIAVGRGILDICLTHDGERIYASGLDGIYIIDTATYTITATLTGFGDPEGIALTNDDKYAYIPNSWNDTILVLNTSTNIVDKTVSVGQGPRELALAPDGKYAYVLCDTATALPSGKGAVYAGTVWVISTGEDSTSSQATSPVSEFPTQLLVVVILVAVIALSTVIIAVKTKPWKKHLTNTQCML
jgi:YVTN family beta-propeller protein